MVGTSVISYTMGSYTSHGKVFGLLIVSRSRTSSCKLRLPNTISRSRVYVRLRYIFGPRSLLPSRYLIVASLSSLCHLFKQPNLIYSQNLLDIIRIFPFSMYFVRRYRNNIYPTPSESQSLYEGSELCTSS
jgi:hypothetical protein